MILTRIEQTDTAENLLKSARYLAEKLGKSFGVAVSEAERDKVAALLEKLNLPADNVFLFSEKETALAEFCEREEAAFLLLQLTDFSRKAVQKGLNACRELRIPYLFFKDDFQQLHIKKVLTPVGFLVEEYEKAQFASAFGRFCGAEITLLQANDYGSKAATTVEKMSALFDKFSLNYKVEKAEKDSFKVDKEAVAKAEKERFDIAIISTSREYGLDDILFGPAELHLIRKSSVPLLLINPHDNLYTLCD